MEQPNVFPNYIITPEQMRLFGAALNLAHMIVGAEGKEEIPPCLVSAARYVVERYKMTALKHFLRDLRDKGCDRIECFEVVSLIPKYAGLDVREYAEAVQEVFAEQPKVNICSKK